MKRESRWTAWFAVLPFLLAACASGASAVSDHDSGDATTGEDAGAEAGRIEDSALPELGSEDLATREGGTEEPQPPADLPPGWECATGDDCLYLGPAGNCLAWQCGPEHTCQTITAADGAACTPEDPCFEAGTCQAGTCAGTTPKGCDDSNACTQDSCIPGTGCQNSPVDEGPCDDGDACTADDACDAGTCKGTALTCDDSNPCTEDFCDKAAGCLAKNVDGACDDGDPCTLDDACLGGLCTGTEAGCECHVDADCSPQQGVAEQACVTGSFCDTTQVPYECQEIPLDCPPSTTVCAEAACDEVLGGCNYLPVNEGGTCAEPENCVPEGTCVAGICQGEPPSCDDGNPCTADACKPGQGCQSEPELVPCDDGNPCTINDFCTADGLCQGFDSGCGPAPALPVRLTSLVFEEPTFCLPTGNAGCVDATALVNSFISQDINDPDSPLIMLATFEPFDLAGDTSKFFLGPGACSKVGGQELETCEFTGQPQAMFPVTYQQTGECQAAPGIVSKAPCFSVAGAGLEIGIMSIALPVASGAVSGTFSGLPWPDAIVSGNIGAFLEKKTADALKVTLPLMPAYTLSELLDPADLTIQDGEPGWKLLIHYEALAMPAQK
jgi:hypothetical protein